MVTAIDLCATTGGSRKDFDESKTKGRFRAQVGGAEKKETEVDSPKN
jgi:hypothetical protein